jgi:hypothetical protein
MDSSSGRKLVTRFVSPSGESTSWVTTTGVLDADVV